MKRIMKKNGFVIILSLLLTLCLSACGQETASSENDTSASTETEAAQDDSGQEVNTADDDDGEDAKVSEDEKDKDSMSEATTEEPRLTRIENYDSNGSLRGLSKYVYDENNNLTAVYQYSSSDDLNPTTYTIYEQDNGKSIRTMYYADGTIQQKWVKESNYGGTDGLDLETTYSYDQGEGEDQWTVLSYCVLLTDSNGDTCQYYCPEDALMNGTVDINKCHIWTESEKDRRNTYDKEGALIRYSINEYNSDNILSRVYSYSSDGALDGYSLYYYE